MGLVTLFQDPLLAPSVAWAACVRLWGEDVTEWEPDTFRIELKHLKVDARPGVMAKILGAQTVVTTKVWTCDYDALFAFALACHGIGADSSSFHHPYSEQLAWALREIRRLHPLPDDLANEGFDPDEIDPAVSCVLADEGFLVAPDDLSFVQDVLDKMTWNPRLRDEVRAAWDADWSTLDGETLHGKASALDMANPLNVQLAKLAGVRASVLGMEALRAEQNASLIL